MNKAQKKQRRREIRQRANQRKLQQAQKVCDLEETEDLTEEFPVSETAEVATKEIEPEESPTEKDLYPYAGESVTPMMVVPGPTSFEELDAQQEAQDKADAIEEVTWDTRSLVHNILNHPEMDAVEKAEAMKAVADEFASRVETEIQEETEKDLDLLELEALLNYDRRNTSVLDKVGDVTKAVVSYSSRQSMPDSNYALVVNRNGKKVRKYLIHDKAHVRNALARAAQMIKRGGSAASDARAALPKIHAAAKRMGIGASTSKDRSAVIVEKDASGHYRWVGWPSNKFIDWDRDILCEDAHKEYVEWLDKNMDAAPVFLSWHTPGTARQAQVDFAMVEKGFLIMSGPLTDDEAEKLLKIQKETDLGLSHGTLVFSRDPKDHRIITKYRMYEVSDLPLDHAANPFTDIQTVIKEVGMDKKQYLAQILGSAEKAEAFLAKTEQKEKDLVDAGVESKEVKPEVKEEKPAETTPVPTPAPLNPDDIVAKVMKDMDVDGLNAFVMTAKESIEKVPVLEGVIADLQKQIAELTGEQEEKLAEKLTPPAGRFAWSQENRPSKSDETVLKETEDDKALQESKPGVKDGYWLSDITRTTPIPVK